MFTFPILNVADVIIVITEILVHTLQKPHHDYPLRRLQYQHHSSLTNQSRIFKTKATKILRVNNQEKTKPKITTTTSLNMKERVKK